MTHTPGPWSYWPKSAYPDGVISQDATTTHIAVPVFHPDVNRTTANARLIAAAPDLLAALKTLVDLIELSGPRRIAPNKSPIEAVRATLTKADWEAARAAIAKAEGRS